MAVLIRDFGNDTECNNISELKEALISKYQNMSVSIVYKKQTGIKTINLVDVQKNGTLIGTHCKKVIALNSFNF